MAEALLKIAVIKDYERELDELESDATPVNFSEAHEQRMRKIFRNGRIRRSAKKVWRATYKSAAVLVLVFAVFSSSLMFNGTVRAAVQNVIIAWFDSFTRFEYVGDPSSAETTEWKLGYVPEGYTKTKSLFETGATETDYQSEDGTELRFAAYPLGSGTVGVDNENSDYRAVTENGVVYHIFESYNGDFPSVILWADNEYDFMLRSSLDDETLLKMAQSVELRKN
jgi:hypothetical protein